MGWGGLCKTQDTALAAHRTAYQYVPGQVELKATGGEHWGGAEWETISVVRVRNPPALSCPHFQNANI